MGYFDEHGGSNYDSSRLLMRITVVKVVIEANLSSLAVVIIVVVETILIAIELHAILRDEQTMNIIQRGPMTVHLQCAFEHLSPQDTICLCVLRRLLL